MAHVCEKNALGRCLPGKSNGIGNRLMRMMRVVEAESVDHEGGDAVQIGQFGIIHIFHVGDVGQFSHAVTEDGHLAVHDPDRHDFDVAHRERVMERRLSEVEMRNAGVGVVAEAIGNGLPEIVDGGLFGINVDSSEDTKRTKIVNPRHVVEVVMGEQHAMNGTEGER